MTATQPEPRPTEVPEGSCDPSGADARRPGATAQRLGRRTKLTERRAAQIVAAVADGGYATVAARAGGISGTTYRAWMARGRDAERDEDGMALVESDVPYADFHDAVREAEASAEVAAVRVIQEAARRGTWQAAAWYLERKYSDRWGRKDHLRQEVSGPDGGPVTVDAKAELLGLLVAIGARSTAADRLLTDDPTDE